MANRKVRSFWISADELLQILNGKIEIEKDWLPSDFKFTSVREEIESCGYLIFGTSEAFDEVPVGECAPRHSLTFRTVQP